MTVLEDDRIGTAIIRPDGVVVRVLAIPDKTLNLVCTVWSPDDERLACEGWDDGDPSRSGIYTVRSSDGGGLARLTEPPADRGDLPGDYSPDGGRLLFKRAADEEEGPLMVVPTAGGEARALSDEQFEDPGRYSPDGDSVLTASNGSIVLLDSEGRPVGRIAEDGHFLFGAVWSPDGSHIAFSDATTGPLADVFTSLPDGTDKRRVTDTPENEINVEWGAG